MVLGVLKPLGVDAALKALEAQASEMSAAHKQLELALQRARYARDRITTTPWRRHARHRAAFCPDGGTETIFSVHLA